MGALSASTELASIRSDELLPCQTHELELWFADAPADVERAKALCADCPIRPACLAGAIDRAEYTGVWGGQLFDRGRIVPRKRPRGRPRKHNREPVVTGACPPGGRSFVTQV
jgi:WhiB family transcriptional regulator, redox-sensing transcriptional regulator